MSDARRFAEGFGNRPGADISVHISGCPKGCARREPATISLVADSGRYGLAFDARAGDERSHVSLTFDEVLDLLTRTELRAAATGPVDV